jgi:hypothetical protein
MIAILLYLIFRDHPVVDKVVHHPVRQEQVQRKDPRIDPVYDALDVLIDKEDR